MEEDPVCLRKGAYSGLFLRPFSNGQFEAFRKHDGRFEADGLAGGRDVGDRVAHVAGTRGEVGGGQVGVEEGLLPHGMSRNEDSEIEEERRLCYVGFTRAEERLYLSHTRTRMQFGVRSASAPSRFLSEIPLECLERATAPKPALESRTTGWFAAVEEDQSAELCVGDRVQHPTYGRGTVKDVMGSGPKARIQVSFGGGPAKTFVLDHAPLTKL